MEEKNIAPDEFTIMLRAFNKMVESMPKAESIKNELLELKQSAESSAELNYRQKDAIVARVNNYLKGDYGNTKKGIEFKSA